MTGEASVPLAEQAAITCEAVTREFAGETRPAVDHVSFQVEAGSLIVLLGPSGCGKTTLLKMINRLYEPTSGKIYVNGVEIHDRPVTDLRRHIG
ncbi:MAG: ATP-binding cassette domain-containing protein, partial [Anaerolineaceae bacterium]|nr:ATP-binding cassette domain-containing protein [Anaerolineaceae bacterium]